MLIAERVIRDTNYFPVPIRSPAQASDNWVVRFTALKRLYRLMTQYFADVLQMPTNSLEIPDLQAVAQDQNVIHTLIMCRLAIAIGVQCERNKEFIERIQGLNEIDQHHLMKAIERVRSISRHLFWVSWILLVPARRSWATLRTLVREGMHQKL